MSASPDRLGQPSLYWYDLETFGLSPIWDRPAQFAGLRTDLDLNVIQPPRVFYCKPPADYLPDPCSCLVTGITPQLAECEGLCEAEFVAAIRAEFMRPATCVVGYNNIRFDDEVMRHALYRNLFDPYEREWRNGNSRWDIIDMIRLVGALRPEGLHWPKSDEGHPSFRLDRLTVANGIPHADAHDALADVHATIEIARRVRAAQPRLYQFVFQHRTKQDVESLLNLGSLEPVVHVSGRYAAERYCLAPVVAIAKHPSNRNGVAVYDLSIDPTPLISLEVEEIRRRVFTASADLGEDTPRIALKIVHLNKCPVVAPLKVLRPADYLRLSLDQAAITRHLDMIRRAPGLARKITAVFQDQAFPEQEDPDGMLYGGGFLGDTDRQKLESLHARPVANWPREGLRFDDRRLPEMAFRYRARNFPETLNAEENVRWREFRTARLSVPPGSPIRGFAEFRDELDELERSVATGPRERALLSELRAYGAQLLARNEGVLPYT